MNRRRRGSQSLSCGEEENVENVEPGSESVSHNRSKKSASVEPKASSASTERDIHSTGSSDGRGKKKKTSFWSNLFKSKISEKEENAGIGGSSSYESVNSVATTNSFSFVSPKKYKGKGGNKGKRIPVDEPTLPRDRDRSRDRGSLPRGRNGKGGTLSRFGIKIGLKKKYNLQSCESLQNILTAPVQLPPVKVPVQEPAQLPIALLPDMLPEVQVQSDPGHPGGSSNGLKKEEVSPQMWSTEDSSTWGTNTRRKRRAPVPPATKKIAPECDTMAFTSSNQVIQIPGGKDSQDAGETNVELKSVTPLKNETGLELEKRGSFSYGALRRNKSGDKSIRPSSCSTSLFAHHSKYQQHRRCGSGSDSASGSNYNTKTRTHVKGKKKAPAPPNPFGDPDDIEPIPVQPESVESNIPEVKKKDASKVIENKNQATQGNASLRPPIESSSKRLSENVVDMKAEKFGNSVSEKCSENSRINVENPNSSGEQSAPEILKQNDIHANLTENSREVPASEKGFIFKNNPNTTASSSSNNVLARDEVPLKSVSKNTSTSTVTQLCSNSSLLPATLLVENDANSDSSNVFNSSNSTGMPLPPQSQLEEEIAQNLSNDRQEKAQEESIAVIVDSTSPSSKAVAVTVQPSSCTSTSSTPKSSKGTKSRFFNFSKSRGSNSTSNSSSEQPRVIKDKDVEEAQSELEALLQNADSNGTLRIQAKKVEEEVKAQLVELKKESDKSPLLFFGSKAKKSTVTATPTTTPTVTTSSARSQNSPKKGSSSPSYPPASPEPPSSPSPCPNGDLTPTKVTPRPWYKRSISSSKSNSPGSSGSRPKISPKPCSSITMLTKFSDLDREAQRIVEENRRKSAEIEFNQNARELINMFNTTFTPTTEEVETNNDVNENSTNLRNEEIVLKIVPSTSTNASSIQRPASISTPIMSSVNSSIGTVPTVVATSGTSSSSNKSGSTIFTSNYTKPLLSRSQSTDEKNVIATAQTSSQKISVSPALSISSKTSISVSNNFPRMSTSSSTISTSSQVPPTTASPTTVLGTSLSTPLSNVKRVPVSSLSSSPTSGGGLKIEVSTFSSSTSTTPSLLSSTRLSSHIAETSATISSTVTPVINSTPTVPNPKSSSESEWQCSRCTLKNTHWRVMCEACYHRKDAKSLNPISSIFERVNANKTSESITSTASAIGPIITTASSNSDSSSSTKTQENVHSKAVGISRSSKEKLKNPTSVASNIPSCENFLSQLPSKNGSSTKEKLEGLKLNSLVGDPEVEELDIEKLRQVRLAFFAKGQQIDEISTKSSSQKRRHDDSYLNSNHRQSNSKAKSQSSDSGPNNLAVYPSSSKASNSNAKELNTTNVFSDGEDDYIDSLLHLQKQQPQAQSETRMKNNITQRPIRHSNPPQKQSSDNSAVCSVSSGGSSISAGQRPWKPQSQVQPQAIQVQTTPQSQGPLPSTYRFHPRLEPISESDSNYYSTREFHRIYENWQRSQECKNIESESPIISPWTSPITPDVPLVQHPFLALPVPFQQQNVFNQVNLELPEYSDCRNTTFKSFNDQDEDDEYEVCADYYGDRDYAEEEDVRNGFQGVRDSSQVVGNPESFSNFRSFNNPVVYSKNSALTSRTVPQYSDYSESDPNYPQPKHCFHFNNNSNSNNNPYSNHSASSSDTEGSQMDRKARSGHRNGGGGSSYSRNSSFGGDKQLTYDDYRKLGAIPKGYHYSSGGGSDHEDRRFNDSGELSRRNSNRSNGSGSGGRRRYDQGFQQYRNETRSPQSFSSQENKVGVDKLLRKLEWAISHGEHRLAAKLAHDLAIRSGTPQPDKQDPITIRVYVEDRFMQQGPFLVQVMPSMSLKDLKFKIEADWGIPSGFQKWILGKRMVEDEKATLTFYEVANDTMAFLYLVTPQIEQGKPQEGSSSSRSNIDFIPPPIPDKPANNNYNVSPATISIEHSSQKGILDKESRDNRRPNSNDFSKIASDSPNTKTKMPQMPPINQQNQLLDEPPELPVKFYQKPPSPMGTKGTSPTNASRTTNTTDTKGSEKLVKAQPSPSPRERSSSIPKDTLSERISPSSMKSKEQLPPVKAQNGHDKISPNAKNIITPFTPIPNHSNGLQIPLKATSDTNANTVATTISEKSDGHNNQNQLKSKRSPPLSSNRRNSSSKSSISPEKLKTSPINSGSNSNNTNLPLSLQQKLANLREAAEQAFGKSFGQSIQNSGKSNSSTTTVIEISKSEVENVKKPNSSLKNEGNDSQKSCPQNMSLSNQEVVNPGNKSPGSSTTGTKTNGISSQVGLKSSTEPLEIEVKKSSPHKPASQHPVLNNSRVDSNLTSVSIESTELRKENIANANPSTSVNVKPLHLLPTPTTPLQVSNKVQNEKVAVVVSKTNGLQKYESSRSSPFRPTSSGISLEKASKASSGHDPIIINNVLEVKSIKPVVIQTSKQNEVAETNGLPYKSKQSEEPLKKSTELTVTIGEPKPLPRVKKQDTSNLNEASPVNVSNHIDTIKELTASPDPIKIISNGLLIKNALEIANNITTPTHASTNGMKSSPVEMEISEKDQKVDGLVQTDSAVLPPKLPLKSRQNFDNNNTFITTISPQAKSPAPGVNKSPSPVPSITASNSTNRINENSVIPSNIEAVAIPLSTVSLETTPVNKSLSPTTSITNSKGFPQAFNAEEVLTSKTTSAVTCPPTSTTQIKGFRTVEPPKGNRNFQNQKPLKDTFSPRLSHLPFGPFIPTSKPKQNGDIRIFMGGGLQRKNSDSSIINVDIGQIEDKTNVDLVQVQGATALLDDRKENNVETYLKMLQLMEKQDLIMTTEKIDCPVCFLSVPPGEGVTLRDCLHNFCKECLVGAVEYAEECFIICPFRDNNYSCNSALQEREIKALVPPSIFEKYLTRSVKLAERKMMNTFHCQTNDCTGWCIFEDDVNIFKCPVCNQKNCITCAAIHEGMNCQQYQRELAIASETDENAKSSKLMLEKMIQRGEALDCPACHVVLLKKWGCDWVRCSYCKTEICWVTKGFRWGPGGKGDMSGGCKCGVNGVRCHPKCTYCH